MIIDYFDIAGNPCKSYAPDEGDAESVVLAVHGFAGSKESPTIAALAKELCTTCNAIVYSFDFPAHGAHPSDDLTVSACREALIGVARQMCEQHASAAKAVFATSFGGYMALLCLDELEEILGRFSLVLRAPAVKMAETFEQTIAGEGGLDQLETIGSVECGYGRMIVVRRHFLEELRAHDVCKPYAKPMLVIHGDSDNVVTPADIADFMEQNPQASLVQIPGAGHQLESGEQLGKALAAARDYCLNPF